MAGLIGLLENLKQGRNRREFIIEEQFPFKCNPLFVEFLSALLQFLSLGKKRVNISVAYKGRGVRIHFSVLDKIVRQLVFFTYDIYCINHYLLLHRDGKIIIGTATFLSLPITSEINIKYKSNIILCFPNTLSLHSALPIAIVVHFTY